MKDMLDKVRVLDRDFSWPPFDDRLKCFVHQYKDLQAALAHVDSFDIAVQAGGAMGVWPYVMSKYFKGVVTCEPNLDSYRLMVDNLDGLSNVRTLRAALGEESGWANLILYNPSNQGTWYTEPDEDGDIPVTTIDDICPYCLNRVSFIQLDIEGREAEALKGAWAVIELSNPVIMIEENVKSVRNSDFPVDTWGDARRYLTELGYKQVAALSRDTVWKRDR